MQQVWTMIIKDRIKFAENNQFGKNKSKSGEICKLFNRGKCTYGLSCRYEHRCAVKRCGKYGHGAHICHKCGEDRDDDDRFYRAEGAKETKDKNK